MIENRREQVERIARDYIGEERLFNHLGWGAEGVVFPTPWATAIKIFTYREKYANELSVYQRFHDRAVETVRGFNVPQLINCNDRLMVIEMTIVQPPYLLDFSQATVDEPRDFTEEVMEDWMLRSEEAFGDRWPEVLDLFYALQSDYGVYYYDLAPRNINFGPK